VHERSSLARRGAANRVGPLNRIRDAPFATWSLRRSRPARRSRKAPSLRRHRGNATACPSAGVAGTPAASPPPRTTVKPRAKGHLAELGGKVLPRLEHHDVAVQRLVKELVVRAPLAPRRRAGTRATPTCPRPQPRRSSARPETSFRRGTAPSARAGRHRAPAPACRARIPARRDLTR
jgi:hypothetical protein